MSSRKIMSCEQLQIEEWLHRVRADIAHTMLGRVSEVPLTQEQAAQRWNASLKVKLEGVTNELCRRHLLESAAALGIDIGPGAELPAFEALKERRATDVPEPVKPIKDLVRGPIDNFWKSDLRSGEIGTTSRFSVTVDDAVPASELEAQVRFWAHRKFMAARADRKARKRKTAARRRCGYRRK